MLPKEAINEFKKLYKKIYGIDLNDAEAERRANNLVGFYAAVYDGNEQPTVDGKNKINTNHERGTV